MCEDVRTRRGTLKAFKVALTDLPLYEPPAPQGEVPISVKMPDRSVRTINLPKMDRSGFDFFMRQLEALEDPLVIEEKEAPVE